MRAAAAVVLAVLTRTAAAGAPPIATSACFDPDHVPALAGAATWYVRPDGGDAAQCTGQVNAPYPGRGRAQPCAWSHPFVALPPGGQPRIAGGDRLVVAPGAYRMGVGAPGAGACAPAASFDCVMAPIPSGPDAAHPTRVVGALGPDGALPQLWGAERAWFVVNLKRTSHAELACLEITDRSECVDFHAGRLRCARDQPPYGDWAATGVMAVDSSDVTLRSLDVHGLASAGVTAGRIADWRVEDVRIAGNGLAGWQGDLGEPSANAGRIVFRRVALEWNGCGEDLKRQPIGCWAEEAGGYGAGLGTAATGGDWVFEDSRFIANTAAGLDLRYHDGHGSVTLTRVRSEHNGGAAIVARGEITIADSVAAADCDFFHDRPFAFKVDDCRGGGAAVALEPIPGRPQRIERSTLTGRGARLLQVIAPSGCGRLEPLRVIDSILVGAARTALIYQECGGLEGAGAPPDTHGDVIWGVADRGLGCPPGNLCQDPRLDPTTLRPRPGSPAVGKGAR